MKTEFLWRKTTLWWKHRKDISPRTRFNIPLKLPAQIPAVVRTEDIALVILRSVDTDVHEQQTPHLD